MADTLYELSGERILYNNIIGYKNIKKGRPALSRAMTAKPVRGSTSAAQQSPPVSHDCHANTAVGGSRRRGPDAPRASPVGRAGPVSRCRGVRGKRRTSGPGRDERARGGRTAASDESARACESLAGTRRRRRRHTWRARTVSRSGDTSVTVLSRDARVQENSAADDEQNAASRIAHSAKTNRAVEAAFRVRLFRVAVFARHRDNRPLYNIIIFINTRARARPLIYIYSPITQKRARPVRYRRYAIAPPPGVRSIDPLCRTTPPPSSSSTSCYSRHHRPPFTGP